MARTAHTRRRAPVAYPEPPPPWPDPRTDPHRRTDKLVCVARLLADDPRTDWSATAPALAAELARVRALDLHPAYVAQLTPAWRETEALVRMLAADAGDPVRVPPPAALAALLAARDPASRLATALGVPSGSDLYTCRVDHWALRRRARERGTLRTDPPERPWPPPLPPPPGPRVTLADLTPRTP